VLGPVRAACVLVVATAAVALVPTGTASAARTDLRTTGDVPVQGFDSTYRLRAQYAVPSSWRSRTRKRSSLTRRYGPIGSCRIRVTITGAAVADAAEGAVARVTRLLPGSGGALIDNGTRTEAAYRVVRTGSTQEVNALLVRPAPTVRLQPSPRIVWIELRARAVVDPQTECHFGGPQSVGLQLGDAFAAARVGGFQLTPGP